MYLRTKSNSFLIHLLPVHIITTFGKTNSKAENNCIMFNKLDLTSPLNATVCSRGGIQGSRARPQIQTDSLDSVFSAKHKRVKFIPQQCQLPSAALSLTGQASESAGTIYPVSFPVLPGGVVLTLFMICLHAFQYIRAWHFYTRFCLSLMLCLSVCVYFPLSSSCLPPCLSPSSPTLYPLSVAGSRGGTLQTCLGVFCSPFSPGDMPDAASTLIFDHTVKRECFLLLLDCTFKKPSLHPVCLRCMSDENSDRFFPTRSASSGIITSPSATLFHTNTHTHTPPPPTSSLKHQIFLFQGRVEGAREEGKKEIRYILKTNSGYFDECSLDYGCIPTGKVRGR